MTVLRLEGGGGVCCYIHELNVDGMRRHDLGKQRKRSDTFLL